MNEEKLAIAVIASSYNSLLKAIKFRMEDKKFTRDEGRYLSEEKFEFDFLLGRSETSRIWHEAIGRRPAKCHQIVAKLFKDITGEDNESTS